MDIETRFEIGDKVYFLHGSELKLREILQIDIEVYKNNLNQVKSSITYLFSNKNG
jgi:hypothetical protein